MNIMWGIAPLYFLGLYGSVHSSLSDPSMTSLGIFCASVLGIISTFGGSASTRPPQIADLFGLKNMGNLTAKQLASVLPAALGGPYILTTLYKNSTKDAINDLCTKIDPTKFQERFNAPMDDLNLLIDNKTVTISRLMEIAPEHVIDPTPYLFDKAFIVLGSLQIAALTCNYFITPVSNKLRKY